MSYKQFRKESRSKLPLSPPPPVIPSYCGISIKPTPEILNAYINLFVYVWLINGSAFWMFPKKIHKNILCGYIWSGKSWESACFSHVLIDSIY
ncbi:MAG: hypothetical protein CVU97_03105 [Firmicutes bacterium HGW-Firmicutes-21]|nr:MAG: hypothetical protein CVU97_03105 [Firmicutes bacterium HGW-Firmicutes-21]